MKFIFCLIIGRQLTINNKSRHVCLHLFAVSSILTFATKQQQRMTKDLTSTGEMFKSIIERLSKIQNTLDSMTRQRDCFDGDTLLDNHDLCQMMNVTKRTLARYRQKKLIRYYKIDRKVFYRASEIREFMKAEKDKNL